MKKLSKDISHYLPLIGIFLAGILGFFVFSYDRIFQTSIAVGMVVSYFVWGVVHHHVHDDLHMAVILEYLIFASLGLVLILSLL